MMEIKKNKLILDKNGESITFDLPTVATVAVVRVWEVPTDYQVNGYFISVLEQGVPEEIPACNLSNCKFLGSLKLDADPELELNKLKALKSAEINVSCESCVKLLSSSYPDTEVSSWAQQVKEAELLRDNPAASAPLLTAIATERGVPLNILAEKVIEKMEAFATASGPLFGKRQRLESEIALAKSAEDLSLIVW